MIDQQPALVTCYVNPDLDGTAGAMAYTEFLQKEGKKAVAGIFGEAHEEAQYVLNRFQIRKPQQFENDDSFDQVILVDSSDLIGMEGRVNPEKVVEIIDHRAVHEAEKFPNAKTQIELVGAAATLVAEKFRLQNVSISRESAILLYAAVVSNTLNFKATVTTDRDRTVAEWLNQTAHLGEGFWKELFTAKSNFTGEKLEKRIRGDIAFFEIGGKKVSIAQLEMIGARQLVRDRVNDIKTILGAIKCEMKLDHIFLTIIDLEEIKNYILAIDDETRELLEKSLGVNFTGDLTIREKVLMRKQIVPLIKAELEQK